MTWVSGLKRETSTFALSRTRVPIGGTLRLVVPMLQAMNPASVKTCVLLRKDREIARNTPVDYVGFEIPDEFVVGYGLDFGDYYRNLPDIVTLKKQIYTR